MVPSVGRTVIVAKRTQARGIPEFDHNAGRKAQYAKWPREVKNVTASEGGRVFEGRRALVLSNGQRVPMVWRSKKKVGFWATCKGHQVYFGKTLAEATLRLVEGL